MTTVEKPVLDTKKPVLKTREEIIKEFENELLLLEAMIIAIDGHEQPLQFSRDMENMPQRLHFKLPEYCTYTLTIHYRVKERPLKGLTYKHVVKKHGVPLHSRNYKISDECPVNNEESPIHVAKFPPETLPGGSVLRGTYPARSTFVENGKSILKCPWTIELIKQDMVPEVGGYD